MPPNMRKILFDVGSIIVISFKYKLIRTVRHPGIISNTAQNNTTHQIAVSVNNKHTETSGKFIL